MLRYLLDKLYFVSGVMSALSIVAIMLLIVMQVIARQFNTHISSSDDISGYLVVWATYFGLAYAMHHNSHIRVELVLSRCSRNVARMLNVFAGLVAIILVAIFFYYSSKLVYESYLYNDMTDGELAMPLWLVQLPIVVGSFIFLISVIDHTVKQFIKKKTEIYCYD